MPSVPKLLPRREPVLVLLLAVAPGSAGVVAQDAPPTFRADANVVVLDVVARDGQGRTVRDLREDEIQVFEDGQRCEIESFRLVRSASPVPAATAATGTAPAEAGAADAEAAAPSRANLVVLAFDTIPVANAEFARKGAMNLLSQAFPPNTWFAVYKIDRSMRLLQPFTANPARLESAVRAATSGDDARRGGTVASLQSLSDAAPQTLTTTDSTRPDLPPNPNIGAIGNRIEGYLGELASRRLAFDSLYGLLALARGLEPIRGRKTIVYFAEAREVPDSVTYAYETTISAANRAGVTIHTVDARGLSSTRPGGRTAFDEVIGRFSASGATAGSGVPPASAGAATAATEAGDAGGGPIPQGPNITNPLWGSFLEHVASDTGGLAIGDTNDLGLGLSKVIEELGTYYEVVYTPPRPEPDGRFRRIGARVTRKGVRLRTRSGYFATAANAPTLPAYELSLLSALAAPEPPHDFAHSASVLHFGGKGEGREALFLAEVPLAGIHLEADAVRGVVRGQLVLLGFVKDDSGRTVARFSQEWPVEGPLADATRLAGTTAVLRRSLRLPPGGYSLETAVEERGSGRASVERVRFTVPPLEAGLALGSLTVVRRAAAAGGGNEADPLRASGVSIAPHLGLPRLPASAKEVPLFLPVYPSLAPDPPTLQLELWRGGEPVAHTMPALPPAGADGRIVWIGGLSTKGLRPGSYEIVATVRQGDATAEERTGFAIGEGVDAPPAATEAKAAPPVPPDLAPVLDAAARYVLDYEQAFRDIAADEAYTQWAVARDTPDTGVTVSCAASLCRRATRADVVFVRLAGAIPWGCFRDVYEVDGQKVRESEGRLEALFAANPTASAAQRARTLLDESARYNIGPAIRNVNFPTLALVFLHPLNQGRFAWSRGGKRRFGSVEGVEVRFDEVARPTLVDRGGHGDLPAKGRFWIDPARGTVLRSETTFRFERDGNQIARAYVAAEYRPEPRLAMWVPSEMREEYEDSPGYGRTFGERSEATARYGGFRRFTVTTDERAALPDDLEAPVPEEPPPPERPRP